MSVTIQRHFVTVNGRWGQRQVHFRLGGRGPAVLLLHQSPQSSRELVPLMAQWGRQFTVIAPDSPGYGLSDPLGIAEGTLDDFAAAAGEFLDALGLEQVAVYGFHTGGMIGMALADRFPARVRGLACNGVLVPTAAELAIMLRDYLPPLVPRWDGGHLAWLWSRIREQTVFFPWHLRQRDTRMDFPMPPPERQQAAVLEFLRAADHYQVAYRAAFVYPAAQVVGRLGVPTLITAAGWDPLFPHLARLPAPAAGVTVRESAGPAEAMAACLAHLQAHAGAAAGSLRLGAAVPAVGMVRRRMVALPTGELLLREGGAAAGTPVLVLHDAGGSARTSEWLWRPLARHRPVLVPDLPGHGESDVTPASGPVDLDAWSRAVTAWLEALDPAPVDVVGLGVGGLAALEVLARVPARVGRVVLVEPPASDADLADAWRREGLPPMTPDWHGGHLSRCWHMVRDGRLYFPWFRRDQQGIRWQEPELDDAAIQLEVGEYLKAEGAWQGVLSAALDYPLAARLAGLDARVALASAPASPWQSRLAAVAQATGRPLAPLPDFRPARAEAVLELLAAGR